MSHLWARVRQARLVSVLVVYLGASWLVLQITELLRQGLSLPPWVTPLAVILLLIGLLVVSATAWVQSRPLPAGHEEVPRGWQVAVGDLRRSVAQARLPHLTWGRAVLGGVVAFSLLFGLAGLSVLLREREGPVLRVVQPAEAAVAPGIAVLPFRVVGPGSELWTEGLVDLFSTNLEGIGGLRKIDPRAVLAAWRDRPGARGGGRGEAEEILWLADRVDARYALTGTMVGSEDEVRLTATLYEVGRGPIAEPIGVDGSPDSVLALVDWISVELLRRGLLPGAAELPQLDLERVTASSPGALKAYLAGEQKYRRSRFKEALPEFERAVELDSTFALALYRLALTHWWLNAPASRVREYAGRAARLADRLPEREALLLEGTEQLARGETEAIRSFRELTQRYPDDVEGWSQLGEAFLWVGGPALEPGDRFREPLRRALELNPYFGPPYIALLRHGFYRSDTADVRRLLAGYERIESETVPCLGARVAYELAWGDSASRSRYAAGLDTLNDDAMH